jgi:hypothetical protein
MRFEAVTLNQLSTEDLSKLFAELIRNNPKIQRAILEVVWACPNIVTEI